MLHALFPVHPAELGVLGMGALEAWRKLPRTGHPPLDEACSIFAYKDERVSRLVWSVKYRKSRRGAAIAGYALYRMARSWRAVVPADMTVVIVPMPVSRKRRRERGFNQCELILDAMEKLENGDLEKKGADTRGRLAFARDLLVRVRHTSRQTMKDREERLESLQGVFAVNERAMLLPAMRAKPLGYFIVVVDDVITTGSTMKDAVDTLRRAGFANTYGLSLAH